MYFFYVIWNKNSETEQKLGWIEMEPLVEKKTVIALLEIFVQEHTSVALIKQVIKLAIYPISL